MNYRKFLLILLAATVLTFASCSEPEKKTPKNGNNEMINYEEKYTHYIADDFRLKTETAERWAAENVSETETETYKRYESDILTVGKTSYLAVYLWETNGIADTSSYLVEKYVDGEKTVLVNTVNDFSQGDFPISVITDGDVRFLAVMGDCLIGISTWHDAGKLIVTYADGDTEIVDYCFTDDKVTDEMLGGREYRGFRCEFLHQLRADSDISSMVFISEPDEYCGVTTRLFELDETFSPISSTVTNLDGIFNEEYNKQ